LFSLLPEVSLVSPYDVEPFEIKTTSTIVLEV